jgi:hypothetical protein
MVLFYIYIISGVTTLLVSKWAMNWSALDFNASVTSFGYHWT